MAQKVKIGIISIIIAIIISSIIFLLPKKTSAPSANGTSIDSFAQCIKDSGAKFYGAFWCSHCQNQKKLFSESKNLPYVECATPDGKGQTQVCADQKIEGYPTWTFADKSQAPGEQTFDTLSKKTGCALPE